MQSNKLPFQNKLIGTGINSRSQFGLSIYDINLNELQFIPTPNEPHDIILSPINSNIVCAFGRRPPIKESYLIDIEQKKIIDTLNALDNHAFYGHGIWNQHNQIISAEIDLSTYQSFYVYRDGNNPKSILKIVNANGSAVHQIDELDDHKIYIANNGDWYGKENAMWRNLTVFHNDEIVEKYFFDLPTSFGLQHFLKFNHQIFLAFREPPEKKEFTNHSPLVAINLQKNEIQNIKLSNETILQLKAEGLSMAITENGLLGMTSLKGGVVLFYDTQNKSEKTLITNINASGISYHPEQKVFHVSSDNGILCEINPSTFEVKLLNHQFFAASHHSLI